MAFIKRQHDSLINCKQGRWEFCILGPHYGLQCSQCCLFVMRYFRHFTKTTHVLRKTENKVAHLRGRPGYSKAPQRWDAAGLRKLSGLYVFKTHRHLLMALCASFILPHSFRVAAEDEEHQKLKFVPFWRTKSITTLSLLWYRFLYEHFLLGKFGFLYKFIEKSKGTNSVVDLLLRKVLSSGTQCHVVRYSKPTFQRNLSSIFFSRWFLSWFVLRPHGWRRHILMKCPLTINGLNVTRHFYSLNTEEREEKYTKLSGKN
jgi:hypothetical protein